MPALHNQCRPTVIDVRTGPEYSAGHVRGARSASFLPPWSFASRYGRCCAHSTAVCACACARVPCVRARTCVRECSSSCSASLNQLKPMKALLALAGLRQPPSMLLPMPLFPRGATLAKPKRTWAIITIIYYCPQGRAPPGRHPEGGAHRGHLPVCPPQHWRAEMVAGAREWGCARVALTHVARSGLVRG